MPFNEKDRQRLARIEQRLDRIELLLKIDILAEGAHAMALEAIRAQVERNKSVDDSVKQLILGLKAKLDELGSRPTLDPQEVQDLADQLAAANDDLASAVTANTPADPAA